MDYHSLPRRQLQALCKKHGIPANAANSDMADALTTLLKPKPQLNTHKSKNPEKRATRSSEPALSEKNSKNDDVEEALSAKPQIPEHDLNREPQRSTRGRGSASAVSEAPKAATSKTAKTPTAGEMETSAAIKQPGTKKVCTRNGGSKLNVNVMPQNDKESVDAETLSPSDKKKEKSGGIVLRRGRVKVRSPKKTSKSPESAQLTEEIVVRTQKNRDGKPSSQSCLVTARRTRKKKRSVTFSDVIEINSVSIEHSTEIDASNEPTEETIAEIQQGPESNLPTNMNSATMAKKTISTRKASRSVSTDVIVAQADHQKISKKPVAKVSKAKELHAFKAEKNASIENGGQSDRKRPVRGKKVVDSVGEAAAKENKKAVNFVGDAAAKEKKKAVNFVGDAVVKSSKEVGDVDDFVKGNLIDIEPAPCARRSRRLTLVPTDARPNHVLQSATEQSKGQSKDEHKSVSIASKKSEGDLPAETSRRGRRKPLGPLELNRVQATVGSAPQQVGQKVLKAKVTQSKSLTCKTKGEALESQQTQPDMKTCNSISVASEAGIQPIKSKETPSTRSLRGRRQEVSLTDTDQPLKSVEEVSIEMGNQKICSTEKISGNLMQSVDTKASDEAHSKAAQSTSSIANSEPDSLQEVSNDAKAEGETSKVTPVMPRSTKKTSTVSAQQLEGILVSQDAAFSTRGQECLEIFVEAERKDKEASEDLGVTIQAQHEQSQEVLALKGTDVPRVDVINSTKSTPKEEIGNCESLSCVIQVVIGKGAKGQNQISEDADLISSMAAINSDPKMATASPLVDTPSVKPAADAAAKEQESTKEMSGATKMQSTSPLVDTRSVKPDGGTAAKDQQFTEEMSSATSTEHVLSRHELAIEKDEVTKQEFHGLEDSVSIISSTNYIKDTLSHGSPVSRKIQDICSPDGNLHVYAITLENSIENYTDNGLSPSATVESATEIFVDIATAEHKASTFEMHHQTLDKIKIGGSMTSGRVADLTEQQPDQAMELNLCGQEDAVADNGSTGDDQLRQLSPILPLCSVEPRAATPMESACKPKQRRPRSIYKSARKSQFSVPWENRSLEATTASLESLDQVEKNAELWGQNNSEMTSDGIDSATSEDEGSSADTEEILSDTEVCNFEPETLLPNAQGDYSCSEDDSLSDSEEDTMSDSSESFSEMDEEELLSGDESEEQETSEEELSENEDDEEEELSESEDDEEDEFEEYEASPVSQPVAMFESFDALYIMDGLEIIAASDSSLSNDVVRRAELVNHVVLENNVKPADNDEKNRAQRVVTKIQRNEDILMAQHDDTSIERMQSATYDSESFASLSSLFASPPTKVQDEDRCSLGILGSRIPQQSEALETELSMQTESVQETIVQSSSLCKLSCKEAVAEIGQQTTDGAENENEMCELVDATEELKIKGQTTEPIQNQCVESQKTLPTYTATKMQENGDVLMSNNDSKAMEAMQSPIWYTDYLTSLSSLFASPPSMSILESNFSQQSRVLETEVDISPESGEQSLCFPTEVSQHNVIDEVEQHTMDGAKHFDDLCESKGGEEKEVEVKAQMVELIENCSEDSSEASSPMLKYTEAFQILESNPNNELMSSSKETEQDQSAATELPCLGPYEPTHENNEAETGDSVILEEVTQNLNKVQKMQEEPGNVDINEETLSYSVHEDEIKNAAENNEGSVGMVPDAQNSSEDLGEQLDLAKGTSTEQLLSKENATFGSLTLAENDEPKEETAIAQDLQILHLGNNIDELSQKQNNEDALELDTAYIALGTLSSVASIEPAIEPGFDMVTANDEIHLLSSGTSCNSIEEREYLVQHECELSSLTSYAFNQLEIIAIAEELEVVQSESNLEGLATQGMANDTSEIDVYSTPKQNSSSEVVTANDEIHLLLSGTSCNSIEERESLVQHECEPSLLTSDASKQLETIAIAEELEVVQSESNLEGLALQGVANDTLEIDVCSTPKQTSSSEIVSMFVHGSPNEEAPTMHCSEIECIQAQVEWVHEISLDECQSSEESKEDKDQSETEGIEEQPDFAQSESNAESLISQVVANHTFEEIELHGTPKQRDFSEIVSVFTHEKSFDESQSSEESKEDKEQSETEGIEEEPDFAQSESNVESLISQVVANDTFKEVELCSTPKQRDVSEFVSVFTHESPNKVSQTMPSAEIESMNAQVGEIHGDEGQSSEECKEDKELLATHDLVQEITKEQSLKHIDLTLVNVRELREMCKENLMSAKNKAENESKKETENVTPAKMPSRPWMSATKQMHQHNTSMLQRDLPSANKRSALKALSSNIKAAPSSAMQTPTAKGSQRPQNLMSAYDGNDGTGKHLITPSPRAPMSSKRDFARSHHR